MFIFIIYNLYLKKYFSPKIRRNICSTLCCIIFLTFIFYINADITYNDTISDLRNGIIARTPLLQNGQTLANLPHGWHRVTGGLIHVGYLGNGSVTKMVGIVVDNAGNWVYTPANQPFNRNFACVLFEMREAGVSKASFSNLDYQTAGRQNNMANLNSGYLRDYRTSVGLGLNSEQHGEVSITNKLINGLGV